MSFSAKAIRSPAAYLLCGIGLAAVCAAAIPLTATLFTRAAAPKPTTPARRTLVALPARTPVANDDDAGPLPSSLQQLTPQQAVAINEATPISSLPIIAAQPFKLPMDGSLDAVRALTCLTMAVYYEAANQSDEGQAAVAQVVLNRVRNPLFPKSVCGVVFEGSDLPTGCQFSFTCDGSLARRPDAVGWRHAKMIAERALNGYVVKSVGEATHYHTMWVVPKWQATLVKLNQIGAHIFYRWPGEAGMPLAFHGQYAGPEEAPKPIAGFDTGIEVQLQRIIVATASKGEGASANAPSPRERPIVLSEALVSPAPSALAALPAYTPPSKPPSMFGHAPQDDLRQPIQ